MNLKEFLLEQFTACYDENGWFVALRNALKKLTAKDATWKPDQLDNSIWGIVAHLNFYNERYLRRFKGEVIPASNLENSETFSTGENTKTFAEGNESSEIIWRAEVEKFDMVMSEWRSAIQAADDAKLSQAVSTENSSPWWEVILHINAHNAHHGGQIVVMRKLQGSWDKSKGVS